MSRQKSPPVYRRLADILEREIRQQYGPGELLPSESELSGRFDVNRHTVRRALDELVAAGMVTRHQGRGTQVVDRRLDYPVSADSKVTHNLAELGMATETRCLAQQLAVPPESIAQRFVLSAGEPLLCVETLRHVEASPLLRLCHWFDPRRLPDWLRRYRGGSTRACLDQHYGLRLTRRRVRLEAVSATAEDARWLQCALHAPLLQLTSDNIDQTGALVEVSISRTRADRMAYHIDFSSTKDASPIDEVGS
ncbi:phosphonate metabolism transcriptional regulator PhnF [Billgrantia endophytica]|uniref:Phosphonate metabolism transcriptional regulator PhnF n=1 Tax=Billgrantia endophytica TaxID=2033802 RepID=A0A2N7U1N1_9GAMM|nr:phosphonate metabolism transcriptional regulator PhnF [Halomonas endophytica]PMR74338.1 phosphonate metabolism transcriptional regulator PhnF [Halomonas endophytica]